MLQAARGHSVSSGHPVFVKPPLTGQCRHASQVFEPALVPRAASAGMHVTTCPPCGLPLRFLELPTTDVTAAAVELQAQVPGIDSKATVERVNETVTAISGQGCRFTELENHLVFCKDFEALHPA
ncbi:hypothetical protein VOLCADRAFT_88297 [Volvox carteri f. nagariensis]|uniref:Uncharacterized protein n=1 Tax=Volvox carteri f. nagariensis TaxID=3068 RepID=D8TNU0_VOLCA|nr:uncharacterized protein VOLCADRAFT_88297 [Volvox carteri f. nagariensis]EFJ50900.1 hypothetical protein VOLCADRAFT_88297 [Volvox carteri f. nagariensis]|eukprot:XP_002947912.1 hypothetical protein VOLCADRAFT_88297 [Volvox carteri f. nagariensis]